MCSGQTSIIWVLSCRNIAHKKCGKLVVAHVHINSNKNCNNYTNRHIVMVSRMFSWYQKTMYDIWNPKSNDDHNDDDGGDSHQKMADEFTRAIQTYWSSLPTTSSTSDQGGGRSYLVPDYVGIRPKLSHPKQHYVASSSLPFQDFVVADVTTHGVPGLIHQKQRSVHGCVVVVVVSSY